MRTLSITIDAAMDGRTVGRVLERGMCLSGSRISRLKRRADGILLNGRPVYTNAPVRTGDVLCAQIGDDPERVYAEPRPFPIPVLWQDADLAVIDKPAGLAVHASGRGEAEITVESALKAAFAPGENPHPVNRLDRGVTGAMVVAKNGYMHERMRRLMHTDAFTREYRAVTCGAPDPPAGKIAFPIGFAEGSTYKRAVCAHGKPACTQYETVCITGPFALVRLLPHTGRTHQLRLHLSAIGCPIAGDFLYGTEDRALIARPALHAYEVFIIHPLTGERIRITAPLPADMVRLTGGDRPSDLGK